MPTIDSAFEDLWLAIDETIPYNPNTAIAQAWRASYREWGSPIGAEHPLDEGGVYQVFANAVVKWTPEGGVELVTE